MYASHLVHNVQHERSDVLYHSSSRGTNVEKIQNLLNHRQHVTTTNLGGFWRKRNGERGGEGSILL